MIKNKGEDNIKHLIKKIEEKQMGICIVNKNGLIKYINNTYINNMTYDIRKLYKKDLKDNNFIKFIGEDEKIKKILNIASKAAKVNSNVVIFGESGTGKELIAEGIHKSSSRKAGPFIRINCGAIPPNLLESELFGHEKGAFTGAIKKVFGKFEQAENESIFLDEIGDLEKSLQVKILRVIQEREFSRVGGGQILKTNARIIAATNKNLKKMVTEGEFRQDLYYRLNVITINLPLLRERKDDIKLLIKYFMHKISIKINKKIKFITDEAMQALVQYNWPGNVRELENILERIITLTDDNNINIYDIPETIEKQKNNIYKKKENHKQMENIINTSIKEQEDLLPLRVYEKKILQIALKKYGSFNKVGKVLGISHKTVAAKCKKYGLDNC